jgi:hypothetical protein
MAKIEVKREYPGTSASECFRVCLSLVDELGYQLFKKRDVANLVICNGVVEDSKVDLSLMVPLGHPTSISVTLGSNDLDESILLNEADRILSVITNTLSG